MLKKVMGGVAVLWLLLAVPAIAATGAISQSYITNADVAQGELVSLASQGATSVELANSANNSSKLVGVAADKPLLELSQKGEKSVQVVVSGQTLTLVSDMNGAVKTGDKITPSPVSGIGMKAVNAAEIVGTAQADLTSVLTTTKTVDGQDGKPVQIQVGMVPVAVNVAYYSASSSANIVSSFVPPFLQSLANAITGKQVSPLRVLLGAAAVLLGFGTVVVMLYTSIRSGVISIGRNPLAEGALRKELIDVIVAAAGVLMIMIAVVYVILVV